MKAVLEYPKEGESEEVDLTDLIKDGHIALSKFADYMQTPAQIDCMTACIPVKLPIQTCKASLCMPANLA